MSQPAFTIRPARPEDVPAVVSMVHELFNKATKAAGAAGGKGEVDPAKGQELLDMIAEIDKIFWETKKAS